MNYIRDHYKKGWNKGIFEQKIKRRFCYIVDKAIVLGISVKKEN